MENQDNLNKNIAYKKAEKRVKEIKNYILFIVCYIVMAILLLYKNYDGNIFNINKNYIVFMLALQGFFLLGYGIYLFFPGLRDWEERKIRELMNKQLKNK